MSYCCCTFVCQICPICAPWLGLVWVKGMHRVQDFRSHSLLGWCRCRAHTCSNLRECASLNFVSYKFLLPHPSPGHEVIQICFRNDTICAIGGKKGMFFNFLTSNSMFWKLTCLFRHHNINVEQWPWRKKLFNFDSLGFLVFLHCNVPKLLYGQL